MPTMDRAPVAPDWLDRRRKPHCLLCKGPTTFTNIYVPGPGSRLAPPKGRQRLAIYSLCENCGRRWRSLAQQIEARIEEEALTPCVH